MKKTPVKLLAVLILLLSAMLSAPFACGGTGVLTNEEMENLAAEKAGELLDRITMTEASNISLLSEFLAIHHTYKVQGYTGGYPNPIELTIAVGKDGRTFILPQDFNAMILRERIEIEDEQKALKLAKGYIFIKYKEDMPLFLQTASDIPWERQPEYANDPAQYSSIIQPINVSYKNETFSVDLYTWHSIGGVITEWSFEINTNGELYVNEQEIAYYVGDCGELFR